MRIKYLKNVKLQRNLKQRASVINFYCSFETGVELEF